ARVDAEDDLAGVRGGLAERDRDQVVLIGYGRQPQFLGRVDEVVPVAGEEVLGQPFPRLAGLAAGRGGGGRVAGRRLARIVVGPDGVGAGRAVAEAGDGGGGAADSGLDSGALVDAVAVDGAARGGPGQGDGAGAAGGGEPAGLAGDSGPGAAVAVAGSAVEGAAGDAGEVAGAAGEAEARARAGGEGRRAGGVGEGVVLAVPGLDGVPRGGDGEAGREG